MRATVIATLTAITTLFSGACDYICASEIVLSSEHQCREPVVTLGQIAEVLSADSQTNKELAAIELFPAPAEGRKRFVSVREIQDILLRRGVNIAQHRFSGASQVAISRAGRVEQVAYEKPLFASALRSANRRVSDAILDHLRSVVSDTKSWNVDVTLSPEQARCLQGPVRDLTAAGGSAPWNGTQRFLITAAQNDGQPLQMQVEAQVSLPPNVVVANRAIPRDTIITAADLTLNSEVARTDVVESFNRIEDVVGRQAARTIAAGAVVDSQSIRQPLLVRRNEIVTVTARAAGIRVSTDARARSEGSLGDLIQVESLHDRQSYYARVCGSREAEVFSPTVSARQSSRPSASIRQPDTGGTNPRIQLRQPGSARNNKLHRIETGNWK